LLSTPKRIARNEVTSNPLSHKLSPIPSLLRKEGGHTLVIQVNINESTWFQ
jgi:hypothetical protein